MTESEIIGSVDTASEVAVACRILAENGHSDAIWGHLGARDPLGRGMWIKRSGIGFEEVTPDDVLLMSFEGEVLQNEGRAHIEWPIHSAVMLARPDVHAVVHSHPPNATAFAAADVPLLPVSHAATALVPPDVPRFRTTSNLIDTPELGDDVARTLSDGWAVLLVNHGIVTAGGSIRDAVLHAVALETACRDQRLAAAFGPIKLATEPEEALEKRALGWSEGARDGLWRYMNRRRS